MYEASPAFLNSISKVKEEMNTVFVKIDDGIYKVEKDNLGNFSGRLYVSTSEVIDELNTNLRVAILEMNPLGVLSVLHKN